jgi:intermediate peptidase
MPEEMLVRLCASKHLFAASEMQVQVFYSALDQRYHGSHPLEGSTTSVLAELQKQYYDIPYVPNTVSHDSHDPITYSSGATK